MKKIVILFAIAVSLLYIKLHATPLNPSTPDDPNQKQPNIQVALLLDTSGSMSGLIDQAKSQLWKIVNELATAKQNGQTPRLELALYEYGKSSIPAEEGFIRNLVPLTTDLDKVSEELFKLSTNGGDEYCGWAIQKSHKELKWSTSSSDLKMIFIAGNEAFDQGKVDYNKACRAAIQSGIIINTVFCGDEQEGINTNWKDGADLADGSFMNINHNQQTVYIDAPQDPQIKRLNEELNDTYIAYGARGNEQKERQVAQDKNAESSGGIANLALRANSKSTAYYSNTTWDLVDAVQEDDFELEDIEEEQLPEEMQKMSDPEKVEFVKEKMEKRKKIQAEILELSKERDVYVSEKKAEMNEGAPSLDGVMVESIKTKAAKKNFTF